MPGTNARLGLQLGPKEFAASAFGNEIGLAHGSLIFPIRLACRIGLQDHLILCLS